MTMMMMVEVIMIIVAVVLVHLLLDQPVFSSQDSRNCLEFLVGIFLMSVTFSCLNVVFTIGWRVGCKFRNRWCCSYWGRPLDANSYWGEASWCSWSDVLPMLLLAWILWLAPLCLIIIICNHKYTYNTETITSTLILYTFCKSYQHIAKCLSIFFATYLPYSAYDFGNDRDLRRHLHCWCYRVQPCSQSIDPVYKCGLK